jgi:hypothetical protein
VFSGVLWLDMVWSGTLQYGIRASVFNTELGWAEKVELKRNYIEDLFHTGQISSCKAFMVTGDNNCAELGKIPNFCC